jgi:hypothetical protein
MTAYEGGGCFVGGLGWGHLGSCRRLILRRAQDDGLRDGVDEEEPRWKRR